MIGLSEQAKMLREAVKRLKQINAAAALAAKKAAKKKAEEED